MTDIQAIPHELIVNDRRRMTATGVSQVDSFDDTAIVAHTALGELNIKGSGLHICRLNTETGDLELEGQIDLLEYTQIHPQKGGLFGRLFR